MAERKRSARSTDRGSSSHVGKSAAEQSKPARKPPAPTKEAIEAGKKNLAKGRKKKLAMKEQAHAEGRMTRGERWAMLLDGTLTVKDLDDEEIRRMAVRSKDGTFAGGKPAVPSHLAAAMQAEAIDRANKMFRTAAPRAIERLLEIAETAEKDSDAIRALMYIADRALGKTPETIRVEGANLFDSVIADSVGLSREIPDDASSLAGALDEEGVE